MTYCYAVKLKLKHILILNVHTLQSEQENTRKNNFPYIYVLFRSTNVDVV
jgi:hypothetical protein